jgi:hypothetical protein
MTIDRMHRVYRRTVMYRDGYVIIRNLVSISSVIRSKATKRLRRAGYIFNDTQENTKNDRRRRQANIKIVDAEVPGFERIHSILGVPKNIKKSWVVLKSLPKCKAQGAHVDYEIDPKTWVSDNPMVSHGCLLAIDDNTTFDVWKGAHLEINNKKGVKCSVQRSTVRLKAGDAVVFRADCLHAGSAYDKENVRLHCYLDIEEMPHSNNRVMRWKTLLPHGLLIDP